MIDEVEAPTRIVKSPGVGPEQLTPHGQAARLARWGFMREFTSLEVTLELRITQVHARLADIKSAGGAVSQKTVVQDVGQHCVYTVTRMPTIVGDDPTSALAVRS